MIRFSLNTFIKICLLDTGGRISEIQKRLNGSGGYDFYKPFQKAVRAHCSGEIHKVGAILKSPKNSVERKRNSEAFQEFNTKFGSIQSLLAISQPKLVKFPEAGISVSIDPLFEANRSGGRHVYSIWLTQKPALSQRYGAVACHLMRRAYAQSQFANCSFFYTDLVSNRSYSEKQITNNTNLILMADVTSIGTLIKEL